MQQQRLGNSGMTLSSIGVGAWAMGGENGAFSLGPQDDRDSIDAIDAAIDCGMNWIDVSPTYGLGHAEDVVGRAIARHRGRVFVFTKCGMPVNEHGQMQPPSLKADSIRRECEQSLRRLKVETIDLYQVHRPHPEADLEEGWCALMALQSEGKIRWAGASNFTVAHIEQCQPFGELTSLQPAYSALTPDAEQDVLPYAHRHGIGTIVYSPLKSGLLSGTMTRERVASLPESDFRKRARYFKEPHLSRNLAVADCMGQIGARHGRSTGEVAVAWTLHHPAVTGAIVGFRTRAQVMRMAGAMGFRLTPDEMHEIAAFRQRALALAS